MNTKKRLYIILISLMFTLVCGILIAMIFKEEPVSQLSSLMKRGVELGALDKTYDPATPDNAKWLAQLTPEKAQQYVNRYKPRVEKAQKERKK